MSRRPLRDFEVLGFASTHDALAAESALLKAGLTAVAVPAPLALGSTCGIAIRLEPADLGLARKVLDEAGIAPTASAVVQDV